ncbi:MAG: hypothetical protein AAFY41_03805 [Bacteroidota bacterium]
MSSYQKWKLFAPLGLVLVGMGLCFAIESAYLKWNGEPTITWVLFGTGSLVVFNSGLCFFGSAIIERIKYLKEKKR